MARLQLALNVSDLDRAVEFYTTLFRTPPAKIRPGYANFEVADPPLKLVLFETADRDAGERGALNHLGVEVTTTDEVVEATGHLAGHGLAVRTEDATTCCYAVQDKVWTQDPDHLNWEVYTVLADAGEDAEAGCCTTATEPVRLVAGGRD